MAKKKVTKILKYYTGIEVIKMVRKDDLKKIPKEFRPDSPFGKIQGKYLLVSYDEVDIKSTFTRFGMFGFIRSGGMPGRWTESVGKRKVKIIRGKVKGGTKERTFIRDKDFYDIIGD